MAGNWVLILAGAEMKLILAAIYTTYTTSIMDDTGIEMIDAYVSGPKGNQLTLRFERAEA